MAYDYIQAFTEGHSYNQRVAAYLRSKDIKCHAPELQIAKTDAERRHLTVTEKDIVLEFSPQVLEVKSSRRNFGGDPTEFPFPDTIVDTVNSFESKDVKPCAYILVSRDTGAMLAIGTSSYSRWKKVTLHDRYQDLTDEFYIVNKSDLRPIGELVQYLQQLQIRKSG